MKGILMPLSTRPPQPIMRLTHRKPVSKQVQPSSPCYMLRLVFMQRPGDDDRIGRWEVFREGRTDWSGERVREYESHPVMQPQFIRVRHRIINLAAIAYFRVYEDSDRIDIRLTGPSADVLLTVSVEGEEAVPVRAFLKESGLIKDLRPGA